MKYALIGCGRIFCGDGRGLVISVPFQKLFDFPPLDLLKNFLDGQRDRNRQGEKGRTGQHPESPDRQTGNQCPFPMECKIQDAKNPNGGAQDQANDTQQNQRPPVLAFRPHPFEERKHRMDDLFD